MRDKYLLYDNGTSYVNFDVNTYYGEVVFEDDHIYVASNASKTASLQPWAAIVSPVLEGYDEYSYVNIQYDSWTQSGTTSESQFAILNDDTINQGSNHRSFTDTVASTKTSNGSGTIKLAWTDGKIIGAGCFSQSNRSCTMKIRKIWFST